MNFEFSKHALEQMNLRNISKEVVNEILNSPHQIKEMGDFKVYQSVEQDKKHLIRILSIQIIWFLQFTEHRKSKSTMKVKYDKETDVLYIDFSEERSRIVTKINPVLFWIMTRMV